MAIVGGLAIAVLTRLRRTDPRTGWIIAAGGAFATTAIAFSYAKGIFHPYYVSMLAPFAAVLVGAAVGTGLRGDRAARIVAPAAILGGVVTEVMVIHRDAADVASLVPLVVVAGVLGAAVLAGRLPLAARGVALAVALGALLLAPAAWSVQTLGHATNGTFPAGGPASAGFGGGGMGGPPGGGNRSFAPPSGGAAPPRGGGMFGGNSASLTTALAYVKTHGGGTIGVSSQQGAAASIIGSGADVAGLGGFSGRESDVTVAWLKQAVAEGKIRWVLVDGNGGMGPQDGRTGATTVMDWVQANGRQVTAAGLYDLSGTSQGSS
jgi:4-amino-4-deoxy-L-arabinose transferase-like glycosyltransferase